MIVVSLSVWALRGVLTRGSIPPVLLRDNRPCPTELVLMEHTTGIVHGCVGVSLPAAWVQGSRSLRGVHSVDVNWVDPCPSDFCPTGELLPDVAEMATAAGLIANHELLHLPDDCSNVRELEREVLDSMLANRSDSVWFQSAKALHEPQSQRLLIEQQLEAATGLR